MILVDTSHWVDFLRRTGRPHVQARMQDLLRREEAVWCDVIRLELWNGAQSNGDAGKLSLLEAQIRALPIDEKVWSTSFDLAVRSRSSGLTIPAADLLIAACAARHGVKVESSDEHFVRLNQLIEGA